MGLHEHKEDKHEFDSKHDEEEIAHNRGASGVICSRSKHRRGSISSNHSFGGRIDVKPHKKHCHNNGRSTCITEYCTCAPCDGMAATATPLHTSALDLQTGSAELEELEVKVENIPTSASEQQTQATEVEKACGKIEVQREATASSQCYSTFLWSRPADLRTTSSEMEVKVEIIPMH